MGRLANCGLLAGRCNPVTSDAARRVAAERPFPAEGGCPLHNGHEDPRAHIVHEYDVHQRQSRGNLPQAFVHARMLECAVTLSRDVRLGFGG
jgi:hypothetical protein